MKKIILFSAGFLFIFSANTKAQKNFLDSKYAYPGQTPPSNMPQVFAKGMLLKAGELAALPRKMLVVLQFTISIVLAVGTIVVYNQVQYSKNRPSATNDLFFGL